MSQTVTHPDVFPNTYFSSQNRLSGKIDYGKIWGQNSAAVTSILHPAYYWKWIYYRKREEDDHDPEHRVLPKGSASESGGSVRGGDRGKAASATSSRSAKSRSSAGGDGGRGALAVAGKSIGASPSPVKEEQGARAAVGGAVGGTGTGGGVEGGGAGGGAANTGNTVVQVASASAGTGNKKGG